MEKKDKIFTINDKQQNNKNLNSKDEWDSFFCICVSSTTAIFLIIAKDVN